MTLAARVHPVGSSWRALMHGWYRPGDAHRSAVRAALGLPTDVPIVMTGHQATLWHGGILAKYFAADWLSRQTGAQAARVVVDQDEAEYATMRVPVLDGEGMLRSADWAIAPTPDEGVPACAAEAFEPRALELRGVTPALASISSEAERTRAALAARRSEPSAGMQVSRAGFDLLRAVLEERPIVAATDLARLPDFLAMVQRLAADATRGAHMYNRAVAALPEARLAPLQIDEIRGRVELPLWRVGRGAPRLRVFSDAPELATSSLGAALTGTDATTLVPRALLMTAFLRRSACDLFIHGTGGGIYDSATEAWIRAWLGWDLAPTVVATADAPLPLPAPVITREQALRAMWTAHRARHDPATLGRTDLAEQKSALVSQIAKARRAGADPLPSYKRLHAMLDGYRAEEAAKLAALARDAASMRAALGHITLAQDRTWPFVWHEQASLVALRDAVASALQA